LNSIGAALAEKFKKKKHVMGNHEIVLEEKGAGGKRMDKRMYFQMIVFDAATPSSCAKCETDLHEKLKTNKIPHIIYCDTQNPQSLGLLLWSTDPSFFVTTVRPVIQESAFDKLTTRPGWTMFGKTYTNGHEQDMEFFLLKKPVQAALSEDNKYGIWYPMRRKGTFWMLEPATKCEYLLHHASIGRAYGAAGYAHDIRLNCFGMDGDDNEFVIGLVGKDLNPLSKVIQDMRATKHTSLYMDKLGPFFVGFKKYQFNLDETA
jgi:chlorite dismutase